jgi:hypothetical protein
MPLLVYLGQTYLKHSNGKWVLLHDGFNNLWIPDIRQADGIMKMLHHPLSIILDPEDGLGSYISLKSVCLHEATNPM